MKSERGRNGVRETVYRKAFKTQQFYFTQKKNYIAQEKVKTFKETVSFQVLFKPFELFESNVLSHFLYSRFTSGALSALIMPVGTTSEYWPVLPVLASYRARYIVYILRSFSHIISYNLKKKSGTTVMFAKLLADPC